MRKINLSPLYFVGIILLAGSVRGFFPAIPWLTIPASFINQPLYLANPPIFATGKSSDSAVAYGAFKLSYFYDEGTTAAPAPPPRLSADDPSAITRPPIVGIGSPNGTVIASATNVIGVAGGGAAGNEPGGQALGGGAGGGTGGGSGSGGGGGGGKRRRREAYLRRYSPSD